MSSVIGAVYLVVGLAFTVWTATAFEDRSQWIAVAPICFLLWPVFVVGIALSWAYFELYRIIEGWHR
jgi:nitrate reductase NapE component